MVQKIDCWFQVCNKIYQILLKRMRWQSVKQQEKSYWVTFTTAHKFQTVCSNQTTNASKPHYCQASLHSKYLQNLLLNSKLNLPNGFPFPTMVLMVVQMIKFIALWFSSQGIIHVSDLGSSHARSPIHNLSTEVSCNFFENKLNPHLHKSTTNPIP